MSLNNYVSSFSSVNAFRCASGVGFGTNFIVFIHVLGTLFIDMMSLLIGMLMT